MQILIIFAVCLSLCRGEYVLDLDDRNIDMAIRTYDSIMIDFYAPWCGHCTKLAPKYEKAAEVLEELGSSAVLARIDATQNEMSKITWGVHGFPTLLYFKNGILIEKYKGKRRYQDIAQYMLDRTE